MQLSSEAVVSKRLRATDSERLSRRLGSNNERKSLLISVQEGAERVSEVTAEKDVLLLPFHDYNLTKENQKRKHLVRNVSLKANTVSWKYLAKKFSSSENKMRLLEKTNEGLLRRYGDQKKAVGSSVRKLVNGLATPFVGIAMRISQAVSKCCFRKISELYFFGKHMRWNQTEHFERRFRSVIDIGGGESLVAPDLISPVKLIFTSEHLRLEVSVLVELVGAYCQSP